MEEHSKLQLNDFSNHLGAEAQTLLPHRSTLSDPLRPPGNIQRQAARAPTGTFHDADRHGEPFA